MKTPYRGIPLSVHGVIEIVAAPALIAAPFLLGFGQAAGAVSIALGAVLMGLALSTHTDQRTIPLGTHAGFDYAIGVVAMLAGLLAGIGGDVVATACLAGFGAAHLAMTASTRFTVRGT
jgi:hypothetical protein